MKLLLTFTTAVLAALLLISQPLPAQPTLADIENGFRQPPMDCWPHTRWWWPGNAGSKKEITRELEEMRSHGIRGVEQISMDPVYEKGNVPYLSEEYMDLMKHTVREAKRLGMEVSINFGGPGWIIGGEFVPEKDRSKDMVPTFALLSGPGQFDGELPTALTKTKRSWEIYKPTLDGNEKLLAVIAGRLDKSGNLLENSLVNLTHQVNGTKLSWNVPEGEWKLMAFWLKKNGIGNAVDHFSRESMAWYCNFLGNKFFEAFGSEFGKTVESLFVDSFELPNLASGLNWSEGLLEDFRQSYGYDLVPWLPAIWYEVGDKSPKIRYDVNEFLHKTGLRAFYRTFLGWCEKHNIRGRIQTYGFNADNIESAGLTHIPEMEITAGEKDQADWFDTRIGPRKYVASGAHLYDRKIVSAEVYTFIHWERYRETLEELKVASDGYLLSGATKFYNHGFNFLPEQEVAPSRSIPFAAYIQPQNVWWKYYPNLAAYIARCSWMLRQGDFRADIALYSPLANQWTINCINPRKWTREFEWGELGGLIVSNGYDYDLVNDDVLQNRAECKDGALRIGRMDYRILIIPNVTTIPLKTMEAIETYVKNGGGILFLERLPEKSTGLNQAGSADLKVAEIVARMFHEPPPGGTDPSNLYGIREARNTPETGLSYGKGKVFKLTNVIDRTIWWNRQSSQFDPFLKVLKNRVAPDFGIDFAYEGLRKNDGLAYLHRKWNDRDFYFVANIRDKSIEMPVTFRVKGTNIRKWDPISGQISQVISFNENTDGVAVPLHMAPWESFFLEFAPGTPDVTVTGSGLENFRKTGDLTLEADASANGQFVTQVTTPTGTRSYTSVVTSVPAPFTISGNWQMELAGDNFPLVKKSTEELLSWSADKATRLFSGTGRYSIDFELPAAYLDPGISLYLDPGKTGNIAEIRINGEDAGIVWMKGQTVDTGKKLRSGKNHLEILVTNTLINRVSGMDKPNPMVPELAEKYGTREKNTALPREFGFGPLPPSGLMGPVRLVPVARVRISLLP